MREDTPPHDNEDVFQDHNGDDENLLLEMNEIDDREFLEMADDGEEYDEYDEDEFDGLLNAMESRNGQQAMQGEETDESYTEGETRATPVDKATLTFDEHTSAVFSCHLHPQQDIAVTGDQDDKVYLWDTRNGNVLHKIEAHTDTVISASFSHDGTYLVTGDMAGNINVYRLQINEKSPTDVVEVTASSSNNAAKTANSNKVDVTLNKVWEYAMGDMAWCFWHDRSNVLFAGSAESGEIYMWRIPSGDCKVFAGQGSCCEEAELSGDGKKLYSCYSDGRLRLWDLRNGNAILSIDDQHMNSTVAALACDKNDTLYASGGLDGKILLSTNNGPVQSLQTLGIVECLAFSSSTDLKMLASATLDGETIIWDLARFTQRAKCIQPEGVQEGVCSMKWLSAYTLAIGTVIGDIFLYDARTGSLKEQLTGQRAHIYDFCYSPRTNTLLSVSEDGTAKIFTLQELGD